MIQPFFNMTYITILYSFMTCCTFSSMKHSPKIVRTVDDNTTQSTLEFATLKPAELSPAGLRPEIVIIGALHESHINHPYYSISVLEHIFETLKPDGVLIESPIDAFKNGQFTAGWLRALETGDDESNVAWRFCKKHHVDCLPYDIAGRNAFYGSQEYTDGLTALKVILDNFIAVHPELAEGLLFLNSAYSRCLQASARIANSAICDSLILNNRQVMQHITENFAGPFSQEQKHCSNIVWKYWEIRNRAMAKNICQYAQDHPGARIVVTTGLEHRPYLIQYLTEGCPNIDLKEFHDIIDSK
jgi:hypothetical protein